MADRKYDLTDVQSVAGSRNGWSYKTYKQIGTAEIPARNGGATLYGIFGVRGDEVLVQRCGERLPDGCIIGVSLLSSSADLEAYLWSPAQWFPVMSINGESVVREVTDEQ